MPDPALADTIPDPVVKNAHRIQLTGESMHKVRGQLEPASDTTK